MASGFLVFFKINGRHGAHMHLYCANILFMEKKFVLDYFGGISKTARALGIKPPTVFNWTDPIPFSAIGRIVMVCPKAYNVWKRRKDKEKREGSSA